MPKFDVEVLKGFSAFKKPRVVKKEFLGMREVVAIQTNTRTYVAEGLASHNCFVYDEYYSPGVVSVHANAILQKTGKDEISYWLIDPSTTTKTKVKDGMAWSTLEEFEDYGIYASPANNEVLAGINRVKEFLKIDDKRKHPQTGIMGAPRLFVFSNCINLIGEFPGYQWRRMKQLDERSALKRSRDGCT